jgi:hypothetical protein
MVKSSVFEKVKLSKLPSDAKVIDTIWAMKNKSNGTLRGRINVWGFEQVEGQHHNASSISAPVTNKMTIKWVLMLCLQVVALHMWSTLREHFFTANLTMERRSISRFH